MRSEEAIGHVRGLVTVGGGTTRSRLSHLRADSAASCSAGPDAAVVRHQDQDVQYGGAIGKVPYFVSTGTVACAGLIATSLFACMGGTVFVLVVALFPVGACLFLSHCGDVRRGHVQVCCATRRFLPWCFRRSRSSTSASTTYLGGRRLESPERQLSGGGYAGQVGASSATSSGYLGSACRALARMPLASPVDKSR